MTAKQNYKKLGKMKIVCKQTSKMLQNDMKMVKAFVTYENILLFSLYLCGTKLKIQLMLPFPKNITATLFLRTKAKKIYLFKNSCIKIKLC